ncbi:histidine kinase [Williamsia sp. 1135]|uniref:sensor histidine kinase n=1 Tax=Williamsia sp. 1135 TaxID=1889262 RepID=UPI000A1136BF|nr:histidine kinase [Williamsia sp. 1135]ORM37493.1 histidine kinase [Williamsia sp. 1135]
MDRADVRRDRDKLPVGRPQVNPVVSVASWWRELSAPDKFRLYTLLTLQGAIAVVAVVAAIAAIDVRWSAATIAVAGITAIVAIQAQPELSSWTPKTLQRWALPIGIGVPIVAWTICAIVANRATDDATVDAARTTGTYITLLATLSVVSFVRRKWWVLAAISIATGCGFGSTATAGLQLTAVIFFTGGFIVLTTLLTLWGLKVVDELERTKTVEARLQVAEERLRFARDLHDVVGRSFSAIAVKSELAATLSRAGAAERATAEIDEVKALAVESMDQMRELVRGYRGIDLGSEVAGARSLLAAAGCDLVVEGDPARVPAAFHEVAAWVVREGTTNIVKHSAATSATLTLGDGGMSLRNNGAPDASLATDERSGLVGLAERLTAVGARLDTAVTGDGFKLEILWEKDDSSTPGR